MDSVKCSRRRLRVSIEPLVAVLALSLTNVAAAQGADAGARGALDAFLSGVKSFTADFKQEIFSSEQELVETQTGTLSIARPNRFRWNQAPPTELVVVADGKKIWTYDVELAEVTVAPFDDSVRTSPAMLLSGDRDARDNFDVADTFSRDGLDWVKLVPKAGGQDFSSVSIGFEGKVPRQLVLVDSLNQITRIALANVVVNPELADGLFEFKVPAGAHVLSGKG